MNMKVQSSDDMMMLGERVAQKIVAPAILELVGDVGAGKTTFAQGLAKGLGISEKVSSPSFTISKRYVLPGGGELVHYDFYRLDDAGIMRDELAETLAANQNIVVVEWGGGVADLFDGQSIKIEFAMLEDGGREVMINGELAAELENEA